MVKKLTRQELLLTVVVVLIAGKLLARVFPLAGAIIETIALVVYLAFCARRTLYTLSNFREADRLAKIRAGIWIAILIAVLNMIVKMFTGGDTGFFLVLVLLMADEMSYPKAKKE